MSAAKNPFAVKNDSFVHVFEVGARDGLQNEKVEISLEQKLMLIAGLKAAGLKHLEVGAFVRADRVPQMADSEEVFRRADLKGVHAWSLVPNRKGLERAIEVGVKNIAIFTAATESFAQRNIRMSIPQSLSEFKEVVAVARKKKILVRGYVSTAFGCPFEGKVAPKKALKVVESLWRLGVEQVSIGDTIGVATPEGIEAVFKPALKMMKKAGTAAHLHDTRGTALANALRAMDLGVRTFDSSAGGLGGCPFAPGATGNLATEDLIYLLNGMGMKTGVNLDRLCEISLKFSRQIAGGLGRPLGSRYLAAYAAKCADIAASGVGESGSVAGESG
ncbi:MAG: hydroxymethylglutaryl-CoA lyase [Bdellovibrionales bacterium]|nr:hydroxymethylglutaryl-CoA lyase [Bdellovibrionales bacterium]